MTHPGMSSRAEFFERVTRWTARTHLQPTRVRLRRMTRLWAFCDVDDSITFATALLEQPEGFQDLVIVHELVHLLFRDHGPHFKRILEAFLPDHIQLARLAPESPPPPSPSGAMAFCSAAMQGSEGSSPERSRNSRCPNALGPA